MAKGRRSKTIPQQLSAEAPREAPPLDPWISLDRNSERFDGEARQRLDAGESVSDVASKLELDPQALDVLWRHHRERAARYWLCRGWDVDQVVEKCQLERQWVEDAAVLERRRRGVLLVLAHVPLEQAAAATGLPLNDLMRWSASAHVGFEDAVTENVGPLDAGRMLLRPAVRGLRTEDNVVYRKAMDAIDVLFARVETLTDAGLSADGREAVDELVKQVALLAYDQSENTAVRRSLWSAIELACGLCLSRGITPEKAGDQAYSAFAHLHPMRAVRLLAYKQEGLKALVRMIEYLVKRRDARSNRLIPANLTNDAFAKDLELVLLRMAALAKRDTLVKELRVAQRDWQLEYESREGLLASVKTNASRSRRRTTPTKADKKRGSKATPVRRRGRPRAIGSRGQDVIAELWQGPAKHLSRREFHGLVAARLRQSQLGRATLDRVIDEMIDSGRIKPKSG